MEDGVSTQEEDNEFRLLQMKWNVEQEKNALKVCSFNPSLKDDFQRNEIHYVGGLDISYPIEKPNRACGCCVVYDLQQKQIVYSDIITKEITIPYLPGYLAYREMTVYRVLLDKLKTTSYWPSLFLVDGHGQLHPRHVGSACIVGLEYNCPTVGVGKNPFCGKAFVIPSKVPTSHPGIDVCSEISSWKQLIQPNCKIPIHHYGDVIGFAYCSPNHSKPIYISVGHLIDLDTAVRIVASLCVYRIPEPIRFADHLSREYIRMRR